jgi:uncharacterized protein YndB with AHSA1/START domain
MTNDTAGDQRVLGVLETEDGKGVVQVRDRFATDIDDLWSTITDPGRLARWLGDVEGDLRLGGEFRARFFASGWEGTGRIEVCEPQQRLLVLTRDADKPDAPEEHAIEVTLAADGDGTLLAWEERGMPSELLAPYGAGVQVHVEDLSAYLAGDGRQDAVARFGELLPAYQDLAAGVR